MNPPTLPKTIRAASFLAPLAATLLLTGCLSRPALPHQTFALETPSLPKAANARGQGVLMVRDVEVSPLFENRSLIYRIGPDLYQADPYAEFLVLPSRALAHPIRACLRSCGAFQEVVEPGSLLEANTILEVHATELYGDFRKPDQLAAALSLRILVFSSGSGQSQKFLSQKEYARRVPLKQQTAAALVAGWDEALAQIMAEVAADLASVPAAGAGRSP
jgi:ABC-type uncharacterized transport system auxiliary subunit